VTVRFNCNSSPSMMCTIFGGSTKTIDRSESELSTALFVGAS